MDKGYDKNLLNAIKYFATLQYIMLSGTFTEVKARRPRLVLGWVTTRENWVL